MSTHIETAYLADHQVANRYSVSRATIWRWVQSNRFIKPVKLSPGCTRWRLSDIEVWEENWLEDVL
ncbi:AlpA family transcriptional regulator [Marinobacterium sp. LSUCC0821]|uniref:helix-turn-helix transcriptional regulator n=1 Tax=Marinobacterium sp. LSUCC0821 TaxID=2668067 RepID=UPI00145143A3|nr:AlpA family phage regulatory protein [Marinobacterium sp. LSUCC0821]QJD72064.1 AlpA family phage regulatory protein [Marinobacterium sp. LSUCC0821]